MNSMNTRVEKEISASNFFAAVETLFRMSGDIKGEEILKDFKISNRSMSSFVTEDETWNEFKPMLKIQIIKGKEALN